MNQTAEVIGCAAKIAQNQSLTILTLRKSMHSCNIIKESLWQIGINFFLQSLAHNPTGPGNKTIYYYI